ncbi:hypothetical protein L1987_59481 [Smallanthus sonchifolius]|uniref:Uncharacterized protein n=1 Tax=Smallanthus sonchifolius TaxID=185202 RepID=A0ACB9D5B9_9ASTR|nr:hypothetical protein L1987_59481 [Smallanthus sonchifolius]
MVETRRSSPSSKRTLSSPSSSPLRTSKRSKAAAAALSSTACLKTDPIEAVTKETDRCKSHVRSADSCKKDVDVIDDGSRVILEDSAIKLEITGDNEVLNCSKKRVSEVNVGVAWGKLISQSCQIPHVVMDSPVFTVGHKHKCDLWIGDPSITLSITLLEITGGKGIVKVNGRIYPKKSTVSLKAGDEVVFSSSGKHAYIFQKLSNGDATTNMTSLNLLESHNGPLKQLQFESESRDPSAFAGASILASLPNIQKELSLLPPLHNAKGLRTGMPVLPMNMKDGSLPNDRQNGPFKTHKLQPVLQMLASEMNISRLPMCQAYKENLKQRILDPNMIDVSFDDFPYYLSETTKSVLIASTYIHLKFNKFVKYTLNLPTVSPRILISGPAGSEIYQETLIKALAKHFGALLLETGRDRDQWLRNLTPH